MTNTVALTEKEMNNFFTLIDSITTVQEAGIVIEADEAQKKGLKARAISVLTTIKEKILKICRWIKEHIIDKVINGAKALLGKLPKVNLKKLKDEAIESAKKQDEGTAKQESVELYRYLLTESDSTFTKINDFLKQKVKLPDSSSIIKLFDVVNIGYDEQRRSSDRDHSSIQVNAQWHSFKSANDWIIHRGFGSGIDYESFINDIEKYEKAMSKFDSSSLEKEISEFKKTADALEKKINEVKNFDPSKLTNVKDLLKFSASGVESDESELSSINKKLSNRIALLKIATEVYKNIVSAKTTATKFLLQIKGQGPVSPDDIPV